MIQLLCQISKPFNTFKTKKVFWTLVHSNKIIMNVLKKKKKKTNDSQNDKLFYHNICRR